jgi:hypothetical protein
MQVAASGLDVFLRGARALLNFIGRIHARTA